MNTFSFELDSPIKYNPGNGEEVEANFIELREPTGKVSHLCCEIEALIQSGIVSMANVFDEATLEAARSESTDQKVDADGVLAMMTGGGVDMKRVVVSFRELFREVAYMGGEKPLTVPRMDEMSHADFRKMMGEYAANFILN